MSRCLQNKLAIAYEKPCDRMLANVCEYLRYPLIKRARTMVEDRLGLDYDFVFTE